MTAGISRVRDAYAKVATVLPVVYTQTERAGSLYLLEEDRKEVAIG
jgi:hypothetical protein